MTEKKKVVSDLVKKWARILNGREYGAETTEDERKLAKEQGIVIIFGASDDLAELAGACDDEVGVFDGGKIYFGRDGLLVNECDNDECPHFERMVKSAVVVEALWCETDAYSWTYKTAIPHETFKIFEDGEMFCRGIVFSMDALREEWEKLNR